MLIDSFLGQILCNWEEYNPCKEENQLAVLAFHSLFRFPGVFPEHIKVHKRDKQPDCPQERISFALVDFSQFPSRVIEPIKEVNPKRDEACDNYEYWPSFFNSYMIT